MKPLNRRKFVSVALKSSGAMLLHFHFPAYASSDAKPLTALDKNTSQARLSDSLFSNGWLEITPDNEFIFTLDKAEIGQNVITSLSAIMAEELDLDLDLLKVQFPKLSGSYQNKHYGNPSYQPSWGTGGSSSVRIMWMPLRHAGAASRALFLAAAAIHWQTNDQDNNLSCKNGIVYHAKTGQQLSYAELIATASKMEPVDYQLKAFNQFTQLGKPLQRQDIQLKTSGSANYGIDTQASAHSLEQALSQPNQNPSDIPTHSAVLVRSPTIGGTVKSYNAKTAAEQAGVLDIVQISNGIAVIAKSYWQAKKAAALLDIQWQAVKALSIDAIQQQLQASLDNKGINARDKGNSAKVLTNAQTTISANYSVPLLAHAPLEPMNCTAWFHDSVCEIWAPSQRPLSAQQAAQKVCGYTLDKIIVHTSFIGGGFGRRLSQDYVSEAVEIARQVNYPIKVIWSREEDMQQGNFRPMVSSRFTAAIDSHGFIKAWSNDIAALAAKANTQASSESQSIKQRVLEMLKHSKAQLLGEATVNNTTVEGANNIPYSADNIALSYRHLNTDIRIGAWRSVGHSYNAFFVESFIDELAYAAKQDPISYRLQVFDSKHPRLANTLRAAAKLAGWDQSSNANVDTGNKKIFSGVACHSCFGSHVTEIIELSIFEGKPKIEQIYCVADCGFVVDPDGLTAQLEGAIIFGLSAALTGKIDIEQGKVLQSNFHDYPVMRIDECPNITIKVIESQEAPGGAGEIATPPAAPALANAWFAATGERVRDLPLIK